MVRCRASILGLLDTPTRGRYLLNGKAVDGLSLNARAKARNRAIGFVFQSFNLIGDLSVAENVELPLTYRGLAPAARRPLVAAALERVGMAHRAKHLPGQLSGGQQQRVAVARAVVGTPSILLADEPTGNLDSANGAMVMDLLQDLHATGSTICMVTHDPRYADRARRTIHLFDGRLLDEARARVAQRSPPAQSSRTTDSRSEPHVQRRATVGRLAREPTTVLRQSPRSVDAG